MNEGLFRKLLEECLERIRQGDSVEACLAAHPEHAAQLGPYLSAAFVMRNLTPPQPAAATVANARNRLLARVADGSGKETVMRGIFKFSHAMMAVGAVFLMSLGLVAAAGSGVLTGGSTTSRSTRGSSRRARRSSLCSERMISRSCTCASITERGSKTRAGPRSPGRASHAMAA